MSHELWCQMYCLQLTLFSYDVRRFGSTCYQCPLKYGPPFDGSTENILWSHQMEGLDSMVSVAQCHQGLGNIRITAK